MDASGKQLEVRGWLQLARMFIPQQELPPGAIIVGFDKLEVIRGYSIGEAVMEGHDRAKLTVRYSYLGEIDYESLIFSASKGPSAGREEKSYNILLTTKYFDVGSQSEGVLRSGPKTWRIEGLPSEPHITIDSAILHVTQLRDEAIKPGIKENADSTIDTLNRLRLNSAPNAQK